jgi:hypothetical protein
MTGSCKLVANLFPPPRVCPDGQVEIGAAFQINSPRTKQHICKPLQAAPQTKVCKKAVFPAPPSTCYLAFQKRNIIFGKTLTNLLD